MEKTNLSGLAAVFFIVCMPTVSSAIPLYYTFEGEVTYYLNVPFLFEETYGIPIDEQLQLGDTVNHTVLIDYDSNIPLLPNGTQRFSAEYISGDAMLIPNFDYGYNKAESLGETMVEGALFSSLEGDSIGDSSFTIYSQPPLGQGISVYDWRVGTQVWSHSHFFSGQYDEKLTIISITDLDGNSYNLNPVPEPATILLLSTGLAGIVSSCISRKKNHNMNKKERSASYGMV